MISGTATLITVASASVRKMPGARARTTSQGGDAACRSCGECTCGVVFATCWYATSSPRSTASRRSTWPSPGTTWGCRSARRRRAARGAAGARRGAGVLVTLEADDAALDEAARLGARLVLGHHPLIFDPLERAHRTTRSRPARAARGARGRRRHRRAHQPRQGARRHGRRHRRACSGWRPPRRWSRPPPTCSSSSASCRTTTPTWCARRSSRPAPA